MPQNNLSVKLKITNSSQEDLTKEKEDSFQMEVWAFPETIAKDETIERTVTFQTGEGINLSQDFGEVEYKTASAGSIKIRAFWPFFKIEATGNITSSPDGFVEYDSNESIAIRLS